MKVNMADFELALKEVKPAFGASDEELEESLIYGIIHFSPGIQSIINDGMIYVNNVRQLDRLRRLSVLLVRATSLRTGPSLRHVLTGWNVSYSTAPRRAGRRLSRRTSLSRAASLSSRQ